MAQLITLASGSSVTLNVTEGQFIVLNNGRSDVARLTIATGAGAGRVVTAQHNGRRVYGPFAVGSITIAAVSGDVRYELSGDATSELDDDAGPLNPSENVALRALVSGGGNIPPGAAFRQMQDALNAGYLGLADGAHSLPEPLLIGSRALLTAAPGAFITNTGAFQHNMVRCGNADYLNAQDGIIGVSVFAADERAAYVEGTLTYTHSGTTLTFQIDGDTAGTPTSIASVISVTTSGLFEVPSGSGGSIYVCVVTNVARNANASKRIRIEPITGMRPMTWSRTTTTLTVTENNHGRNPGDFVQLWGTNVRRHGYIQATTANTWTMADTRGANSGSGRVFGVNGLRFELAGSTWDQARGVLTASNTPMNDHTFLLYACSGVRMAAPTITRNRKYGVYFTGCSNVIGNGLVISGDPATNNDGLHINGPAIGGDWTGVRGSAGDNLTAFGCTDIIELIFFWPAQGTVDIERWKLRQLRGEGAFFELCRLFNANSGWIRGIEVDGVSGTVHAATSSVVTVMEDSVTVGMPDAGATNVDGFTVRNVTAVRADGSQMPTYTFTGAGTRRGIRIEEVQPIVAGTTAGGTVRITDNCTLEDLTITTKENTQAFAGAFVALSTATSRIKRLTIESGGRLRGDNQAPVTLGNGSAATPILVDLSNAAARIDSLQIRGVVLEDVSGTGNRARLVNNSGIINSASLNSITTINSDSFWRQNTGATTSTLLNVSDSDLAGTFGVQADAGIARIALSNTRVAGTAIQLAATSTFRLDSNNCQFDNVFLRCAANNPTVTVTASGSSAVTAALQVTGGTPLVRVGGAWSMAVDGALLDSTATNHTVGASFYNTNAAFGVPGVGAYVRGATAWVRVAA